MDSFAPGMEVHRPQFLWISHWEIGHLAFSTATFPYGADGTHSSPLRKMQHEMDWGYWCISSYWTHEGMFKFISCKFTKKVGFFLKAPYCSFPYVNFVSRCQSNKYISRCWFQILLFSTTTYLGKCSNLTPISWHIHPVITLFPNSSFGIWRMWAPLTV